MPGKGAVIGKSSKQKINTKSSTEAEFVGADDIIGDVLWTRHFLRWQGWGATDNIIYQDNESAMKLENNGKASSTKRTKHIDIKYYFITDRVKAGDVHVAFCPTLEMVADFFTKPLQGRLFHKFRALIMNIPWSDPKDNIETEPEIPVNDMVKVTGCGDTDSLQPVQECVTRGGNRAWRDVRPSSVSFAEPVVEVRRGEYGLQRPLRSTMKVAAE